MQSRCLLRVIVAWSSLILPKAQDVTSGQSCVRWTPANDGQTRVTFLWQDATGARSLYLSVWSQDTRPVACQVNTSPPTVERYRSLCDRSGSQGQEPSRRFNLSALLAPDAPCALLSSSSPKFAKRTGRDVPEGKTRRKRAWIFPGTLWCGTGSKATGYDQLGMFESADRCCREHDHCLHIIQAFTVNYGVYNPNFFTVSHCDCDQRFRRCLLGVNDTISSMVGYSFFDILRVPCFELKQKRQCTEMYSWGTCKVSETAPYAVFKSPLPYTDVTNNTDSNMSASSEEQHVNESVEINPDRESTPKSEHSCRSRHPPRGNTLHHRRKKGKGCKRRRKVYPAAPSQTTPMSSMHTTAPSLKHFKSSNRAGEESSRKGPLAEPTQRSQVVPQETFSSYPAATSTTQSAPSLTPTKNTEVIPKQSACCGFKVPVRGDTFQPHCKGCLEQKTTAVTPSAATYGSAVKALRLKETTETPKRDTLERHWSANKVKTVSSNHKDDNQLLCGSLKHLDDCKYKIHPLERKYDLQNTESKTAYHCDCTSRLAVQTESINRPSVLPKLLMDYVSPYCFKLPKKKKCHHRSCSGGFIKASDLLQALRMIEEKDSAGVQNSGNVRRRGIPARLYKRCLRLQREADVMAQLTLF